MFKHPIARDLCLLTAVKLAVIIAIYFAFFAPFDGRPVDTASHLLGALPGGPAPAHISTARGS